ncbi:MAG: leucyl aminopeptidase family protein [Planctomycetes bacterium]|nr:leucyl aminopeptidase family protein [Planctomycetota bacterium]
MKLTFAADRRALTSADHLLLLAPAATFGPRPKHPGALSRLCGEQLAELAMRLGKATSPGLLGSCGTSLGAGGQRLTVGVLPDRVSRHATPSRAESVRKLTAQAGLASAGKAVVLVLVDDASHALAAGNAVSRALSELSYKTGAKAKTTTTVAIACHTPDGVAAPLSAEARDVLARGREAMRFVDTPPTELDPAAFSTAARKLLRAVPGVKVQEIVGPGLLAKKLGGVHAVGRCALSAPRVVVATAHQSAAGKGKKGPHVALVGKGITYDTGGLHLKARGAMETMKADMGGGAAVLGAFLALARHHKRPLSLVLCLAENAIGPAAYKPDDVLTMHSGKTVEINNTDAEGRLLLADGCSYAARVLKADVVLDAATLTGAQGVATGDHFAAVVSNDDSIERALCDAGRDTGDLCWPLPFAPEFFRSEFASPLADMRNSVKNRSNAQVSCAAEFVHWHVDGTGVRWGHVDLASPAFRGDRGTGFGVALLHGAVRRLQG